MTLQNFKTYVCELAFLWQHFSLPHKESIEKSSKKAQMIQKKFSREYMFGIIMYENEERQ